MHRLVFISHSATLTGAPLIVSSLVDYLSERRRWQFDLLFLHSSSLSSSPSLVSSPRSSNVSVYRGILKDFFLLSQGIITNSRCLYIFDLPLKHLRSLISYWRSPRLIYSNSIASLKAGYQLKSRPDDILVLHLHEMRFWIQRSSSHFPNFDQVLRFVDIIVAPSHHCLSALQDFCDFPLEPKAHIIPEPNRIVHSLRKLSLKASDHLIDLTNHIQYIKSLGRKLCICVGTDSWRKGLDHFLSVASHLLREYDSSYHFLWISLPLSPAEKLQVDIECELFGITDFVDFTTPVCDFERVLLQSDCYLLTSREDPMPVAALEAMNSGVPVVCFNNTGGVPDLLRELPLQVVPYGDTASFAASVHALVTDPLARSDSIQKQQLISRQLSPENVYGSILKLLDQALNP